MQDLIPTVGLRKIVRYTDDFKMPCFSRANHEFEKGFELKNSSSLLYIPIYLSAETWKNLTNMQCQFFSLELNFKREKPVLWKAFFLQSKD